MVSALDVTCTLYESTYASVDATQDTVRIESVAENVSPPVTVLVLVLLSAIVYGAGEQLT